MNGIQKQSLTIIAMHILLLLTTCFYSMNMVTKGNPQVPAMFVLGDSLVDPGNNNEKMTIAKANFKPNGIDFPHGATGRFCNGATVVDHLCHLLRLPLIPPYNNPNTCGLNILHGVNYGSGGSGILNETGSIYGILFTMDEQVENFKKTLQELRNLLERRLESYLHKSLFFICTGSNDYLRNYLLPFSDTQKKYKPHSYAKLLVHRYSKQLKELYKLGGRKFIITGIGPLGCIPSQIANSNTTSTCVESTNKLALMFNVKLKEMLEEHKANLNGSYFLYWDTYSSTMDVINNHLDYGFEHRYMACCGLGRANAQTSCLPVLSPCNDRNKFVFWDAFHPSDLYNAIASKYVYSGNVQHSYPKNVKELVET